MEKEECVGLRNLNQIPVPDDDLDRLLLGFNFQRYLQHIRGRVLDVGCGSGGMTELIAKNGFAVEGLDGSSDRIRESQLRLPDVKFHCSFFEDFKPESRFDTCVSSSVLEHVKRPVDLLRLCYVWLSPGGVMIVGVPNLDSLHKQVGRAMGLTAELTEKDKAIGHVSVFTPGSLNRQMTAAGFRLVAFGGVTVKPLPNDDLRKLGNWHELMQGYFKISDKPELQRYCSVIYAVGEKRE